jgi:hypothetical protein
MKTVTYVLDSVRLALGLLRQAPNVQRRYRFPRSAAGIPEIL